MAEMDLFSRLQTDLTACSLLHTLLISLLISCIVPWSSSATYPSQLSFQPASSSPSENEYVLDLNKLGGDPDDLMAQIKELASALQTCELDPQYQLSLYHIRNRSVTCNDGSPAGFYLRKSGGKKWLIYLEGGSFCFNHAGCSHRENRLKSSRNWPKKKIGSGILSADPDENPVWWKANVVYVPYCSSDVWSGTATAEESGGYAFMGALILEEVIKELISVGILEAKQLILAGSSAGGTGVLLNIDRVAELMAAEGSSASVRGLADSGWFLETESLDSPTEDCSDFLFCNPSLSIKLGSKFWRSYTPRACTDVYGQANSWKCFFGFRIHETLKSPVFIFQWLYDEAQLTIGMGGPPREIRHWNYMQKIGRLTRVSLRNATTVFAPACYAHMILLQSNWAQVQVRNTKLSRSIQCWLKSSDRPARQDPEPSQRSQQSPTVGSSNRDENDEIIMIPLVDSLAATPQFRDIPGLESEPQTPRNRGGRRRQERSAGSTTRRGRNNKKKKKKNERNADDDDESETSIEVEEDPLNSGGVTARDSVEETSATTRSARRKSKKCQNKLVDHATCPHCNQYCPKPINTSTGEEMEFLHFLRLAGMDFSALAEELGLDPRLLAMTDPNEAMLLLAGGSRRNNG